MLARFQQILAIERAGDCDLALGAAALRANITSHAGAKTARTARLAKMTLHLFIVSLGGWRAAMFF
jgi:hypothetical protein